MIFSQEHLLLLAFFYCFISLQVIPRSSFSFPSVKTCIDFQPLQMCIFICALDFHCKNNFIIKVWIIPSVLINLDWYPYYTWNNNNSSIWTRLAVLDSMLNRIPYHKQYLYQLKIKSHWFHLIMCSKSFRNKRENQRKCCTAMESVLVLFSS